MAFYKKVKQKGDSKWHPRAVTKGRPYTTDEVAQLLSDMSTVTPGDTYAVLMNLGTVLGKLMGSGRSVKLKGIGTFYYTCRSEGTGVDTPELRATGSAVRLHERLHGCFYIFDFIYWFCFLGVPAVATTGEGASPPPPPPPFGKRWTKTSRAYGEPYGSHVGDF